MKRFVEGADRDQATLFPECLEDWIDEDNPVRVVDVFIDGLDLGALGFCRVDPKATGRPSYHPSVLLKLYVYGYLNAVQIEQSVTRCMHQLDSADRQEPSEAIAMRTTRLKEKIAKLGQEMQRLEELESRMLEATDEQISLTDPDARSMATSGRGSGVVGYNVQTAVDTEHHLIVAHEVTTSGSDRLQLAPMSQQAMVVLDVEELDVVADRGYFTSEQILECEQTGVTVTLPKPQTSGGRARGLFVKADFRYLPDQDAYLCPAGEVLPFASHKRETGGLNIRRYATKACAICKLKDRCTTARERQVLRWEHEDVLEEVQRRLDRNPQAMRVRRETVDQMFQHEASIVLAVAGAVGAALTFVGAFSFNSGLRRIEVLALTMVCGTAGGYLFSLDPHLSEIGFFGKPYSIQFALWQGTVASCVGYGLAICVPAAYET